MNFNEKKEELFLKFKQSSIWIKLLSFKNKLSSNNSLSMDIDPKKRFKSFKKIPNIKEKALFVFLLVGSLSWLYFVINFSLLIAHSNELEQEWKKQIETLEKELTKVRDIKEQELEIETIDNIENPTSSQVLTRLYKMLQNSIKQEKNWQALQEIDSYFWEFNFDENENSVEFNINRVQKYSTIKLILLNLQTTKSHLEPVELNIEGETTEQGLRYNLSIKANLKKLDM